MLIRSEEKKDWSAVRALNTAAFETPAEANLVDTLRQQARPVVSLVAERGGWVQELFFLLSGGRPAQRLSGWEHTACSAAAGAFLSQHRIE